jgi:hypothetical protein
MKRILAIASLCLSGIAFCVPGTYDGTGTLSLGGAKPQAYHVTVLVDELQPGTDYRVTESYDLGNGQPMKVTSDFHFEQNGTIVITRNGVRIGCGYRVAGVSPGDEWLDYRMETDQGPLHVNQYFSAAAKTVYRMGDLTELAGVGIWRDTLPLQGK